MDEFQPSGPQGLNFMTQPQAVHAALEGMVTIDARGRIVMVNPAAQRMFGRTADELMGCSLDTLLPERFRRVHEAHVRRFIASDEVERPMGKAGHLVGLRANGEEFPLEAAICKVDLMTANGLQPCCTAMLYDRSKEMMLSAEVQALNKTMRSVFDRVPTAIWITDGDHIAFANQACCKLFGVDQPEMLMGTPLRQWLHADTGDQLRLQVTQVNNNAGDVSTLSAAISRADGNKREVEFLVAELPDHGRKFVQMVITDVTRQNRERRDLLRSRRTLRELSASIVDAREEERRRIARELHDELGQRLMALKLGLAALHSGQVSGATQGHVQDMIEMVDQTVASTRRIAMGLRPMMLDDLGLEAAIEWQVDDFRKHSAARTRLQLNPFEVKVPPAVSIAVYRILQEALTNISRHADANEVSVALGQNGPWLELTVEDYGIGFSSRTSAAPRTSFGLIGMRERVLLLGGHLSLSNLPNGGARLEVLLPLRPSDPAETHRLLELDVPPPRSKPGASSPTEQV